MPEAAGDEIEASVNLPAFESWASISAGGVEIPTASLALPVAILALYQAFAWTRRSNEKRLARRDQAASSTRSGR